MDPRRRLLLLLHYRCCFSTTLPFHLAFLLFFVYAAVGGAWFQIGCRLAEPGGEVRRARGQATVGPSRWDEATGKRERPKGEGAGRPSWRRCRRPGPFAVTGLTRLVSSLFTTTSMCFFGEWCSDLVPMACNIYRGGL